jgi:hypothetical protein
MGTGVTTFTIAAIPVAATVVAVGPRKRINVVDTLRETVACTRWIGSLEKSIPGAALSAGYEILTVSSAIPPNPLFLA